MVLVRNINTPCPIYCCCTSSHCWLDGLEALCLMPARQRNPRLSRGGKRLVLLLLLVTLHTMDRTHIHSLIGQLFFRWYKKLVFPRIAVLLMLMESLSCFRRYFIKFLGGMVRDIAPGTAFSEGLS